MLLAVALTGLGSHPAAGRADRSARTAAATRAASPALARAEHWTALFAVLDDADVALATIADGPAPSSDPPRLPWLDAALIACRVAPATRRVGIVPQIPTVTTDPFMVSTQVATLDHVSGGRAGWQPHVSLTPDAAGLVGPRPVPPPAERYAEAAEHIEVVRRLWDSWDDDAEIRDVATNRFVDRERLHRIDYQGRYLRIAGPSITPRPPQGQPVIAIAAGGESATRLAAEHADVIFVDATTHPPEREIDRVTDALTATGRDRSEVRVLADLAVVLDDDPGRARERLAQLDDLASDGCSPPSGSPFAGTPAGLAQRLAELTAEGADGVRLHPGELRDDLPAILFALTQSPDAAAGPGNGTLRGRLGLNRPAARYATAR